MSGEPLLIIWGGGGGWVQRPMTFFALSWLRAAKHGINSANQRSLIPHIPTGTPGNGSVYRLTRWLLREAKPWVLFLIVLLLVCQAEGETGRRAPQSRMRLWEVRDLAAFWRRATFTNVFTQSPLSSEPGLGFPLPAHTGTLTVPAPGQTPTWPQKPNNTLRRSACRAEDINQRGHAHKNAQGHATYARTPMYL